MKLLFILFVPDTGNHNFPCAVFLCCW